MSNKDRYKYLDDRRLAFWRRKPTHEIVSRIHKGWLVNGKMIMKLLIERGFDPYNLPTEGELKEISWFKLQVAPQLTAYDLKYTAFDTDEFGSYKQVEFESDTIGGNVDFGHIGWLNIFVWDYANEKELMNVQVEPADIAGQHEAFRQLFVLLSIEVAGWE